MNLRIWGLTLLLGAAPLLVSAEATSQEERLSVLRYGIESEVLDLVRSLKQEKNLDFRDQLTEAYDNARNDDLKEALLLFFLELKDKGLEDRAIREIADPKKKGNSLLLNAVSYLTEIQSDQVKDTLVELTKNENKILALASIRALGKLGARDKDAELLRFYQDAETDPNFKPDLIWALGEMKSTAAVEVLLKEYDENESQPLLRKSILEALGKIGDGQAWDRVEAALKDINTDIRAAAVATVAAYPGRGDQTALLTAALRDSQVAVRTAGAQAAKAAKLNELKELLTYRVNKDPEAKVRVAALQALAAYDDGAVTVLSYLANNKTEAAVWREALTLSLDQKYPGTYDALKTVVEADLKDKNSVLTAVVAGAVLPQRETFRALFGLILTSEKVPARAGALRAISVGKFTEYEGILKSLSVKDPDPGIKAQATAILKSWAAPPPDTPKK